MSCPDWRVLRDDRASSELTAAARGHLAECEGCREAALAHDPTLMFCIATASSSDEPPDVSVSSEMIARMRERVAGARAMATVRTPWRDRLSVNASRLAAAVLLPVAAAGLITVGVDRFTDSPPLLVETAAIRPPSQATVDPLLADALARLPLIEGAAPVSVQEEGIGYDLVMVVDAGLEL